MMTAAKTVLLALTATPLQSAAFHPLHHQHTWSWSRVQTLGNDNEEIFNDFEDMLVGGRQDDPLLPSETQSLQARLDLLINQEHEDEVRIAGNWKNGQWSVRGCSLDAGNDDKRILVSTICPIDDSNTVLVGRSDGSICWLELGTEYIARFVSKLTAIEGKNETIRVMEQLRREDTQNEISSDSSQAPNQFEVVRQVMTSGGGIDQMFLQDELLVCATSGTLEYWILSGDEPISEKSKILCETPSPVVSICAQALNGKRVVICTCKDGDVLTWDIDDQCAIIQSRKLSAVVTAGDIVLSFYSDETYSYFGTSQGHLLVYSTIDILSSTLDIDAIKRFSPFAANGSSGVSAIVSSPESAFSSKSQASMTLIAGSTNGKIKQYALIPQNGGLEHWPRLESQSIPGKRHMIESASEERIRALRIIPDGILAATSSQLILWNPENGKLLFEMLGFDFESSEPSLVLLDSNSFLITNGMKHLVCLHDFSAEELDLDDNFEAI